VRFTLISSFRRLLPNNIADRLHGR
jgi:hypothetical protein